MVNMATHSDSERASKRSLDIKDAELQGAGEVLRHIKDGHVSSLVNMSSYTPDFPAQYIERSSSVSQKSAANPIVCRLYNERIRGS